MNSNESTGVKLWWFSCGALLGMTTLTIAMGSAPKKSIITDDTAIYQNLSDISVPKEGDPNFDADISKLSGLENQYRERLPSLSKHPSMRGPMQRITQKKYRPGKKQASAADTLMKKKVVR